MVGAFDIVQYLRALDRERYIAVLLAPEAARPALAALHAFASETARIRELVSEPLPGEIRLQWWRDVLVGERGGEGKAHPVAFELLAATDRFNLSRAGLIALCDARVFDLYDDPMPTQTDLEGYLGETVSIILQMSVQVLNGGAAPSSSGDAAGHGGVAFGIADLLRQMPRHRRRGQVFVPGDILAATGLDAAQFLAGEASPKHDAAVQAIVALGRDHLAKARPAVKNLASSLRSPFCLLALCEPIFARAERLAGRCRNEAPHLSPFTTQWHMMRAAMTGR